MLQVQMKETRIASRQFQRHQNSQVIKFQVFAIDTFHLLRLFFGLSIKSCGIESTPSSQLQLWLCIFAAQQKQDPDNKCYSTKKSVKSQTKTGHQTGQYEVRTRIKKDKRVALCWWSSTRLAS